MATANQPPVNGSGTTRTGLVPTNSVTWDKHTVRARIDPTLSVADVIKQLCLNLKIQHSSTNYALRDELDQLVTNENLKKMIKAKSNLKCVQIALCFNTRPSSIHGLLCVVIKLIPCTPDWSRHRISRQTTSWTSYTSVTTRP